MSLAAWLATAGPYYLHGDYLNALALLAERGHSLSASRPTPKANPSFVRSQAGVAVIPITGLMAKSPPLDEEIPSTSTVDVRQQLAHAVADDAVSAILLYIDSPGGTVSGTPQLHHAVATAAKIKPVIAFADDCMCSAAYFVATAASKIITLAHSQVGSIGTYTVVRDTSELGHRIGIRTHVIASDGAALKGMGTPGTPVTEEHLAAMQNVIDAANVPFLLAVANGRRLTLDALIPLATGMVWSGRFAKSLGLVDDVVTSFDSLFRQIVSTVPPPKKDGPVYMDTLAMLYPTASRDLLGEHNGRTMAQVTAAMQNIS